MMSGVRIVALVALLGITLILPGAGGPIAAAVIWAASATILARSQPNGLMSLACIYVLVLGAFHLGLVVPSALGLALDEPPPWMQSPQLRTALGLFSTATVSVALGASLAARPQEVVALPTLPPQPQLFGVGCLVALLGAGLLWIGVWQLGLLSSGYDVYFERAVTEDVRFFGFGLMLFPIGLLVAAVGATSGQMAALGLAFAVVLGPLFLAGFRGPTLVQMMALFAVWVHKDGRTARRVAAASLLAAVILVPVIKMSRNAEADGSEAKVRVDPLAVLEEAGGSLYPLVVTAESVEPGVERLWMGRSYVMGLKRIIPNVSTRWSAPDQRVLTPSAWATLHADQWTYEHGGGIGFSGIAEPYLNFGLAGVVSVFVLIGWVLRRWDHWLCREPFRAALGAASFGCVLWTVRNDSIELFRVFALAGLTVLAAWLAARLGTRRQLAPPAQPVH